MNVSGDEPSYKAPALLDDIIRSSGLRGNASYLTGCFHAISHHPYETLEVTGSILLCSMDHALISRSILLTDPVALSSIRGVRKLLEISSATLQLLCDGEMVFGFVDIHKADTGQLYTINFEKRGVWKILYQGNSLLVMEDDRTLPPAGAVDEAALKKWLSRIFTDMDETSQHHICRLCMAAAEQSMGTNLLITENAAGEVSRLRNQSTLVQPFLLTPSIIRQVTRIDGTVIIDKDGVCHAIGAILDGYASRNGNRARGGRYNSAVMYCETAGHPCAILIISQDGDIDLVPSLH